MASIFTRIIQGEIPCYKIIEDTHFIAFLDVNPNAKGHTLVVPKKEVNKLFELDDTTYNGLMSFTKKVALALKKTIPCKRIGMSVIGLEVPHVHVHLIPLQAMEDIQFNKKEVFTPEEMHQIATAIKKNL